MGPASPIGSREFIDGLSPVSFASKPHRRRDEPSRTDTEVAIGMSVTRLSRDDIVRAISDGARAARPHEIRDWTTYAGRAVDYASSAPGRQLSAINS